MARADNMLSCGCGGGGGRASPRSISGQRGGGATAGGGGWVSDHGIVELTEQEAEEERGSLEVGRLGRRRQRPEDEGHGRGGEVVIMALMASRYALGKRSTISTMTLDRQGRG